jgi:tetratricopeptide (TPR) repeat protein
MLIRQAQGYLDLVHACCDICELAPTIRDPLVYRAMDALGRLPKSDRRKPDALYLTGQAFRALELYRDAIGSLREAARIRPEKTDTWLALGWCYKRIGRLDRAIESLEEALTIDPGGAIIHYNLACYWSLAGNVDVALNYLGNSLQIDESFRNLIDAETDFDPIRDHPAFRELTVVVV